MLGMTLLSACQGQAEALPADTSISGDPTPSRALAFDGAAPRNVIMISIDTVERSRMGRYSGSGLTPRLASLAENGVSLDDHASCSSWTYSSINCALIGRYNQDLGYEPRVGEAETALPLPPDAVPLAEILGNAGFQTRLISTNGLLSETTETARGYTEVEMALDVVAEGVTRRVLEQADTLTEPFLLHVHYMDPHMPYAPPVAFTPEVVKGLDPVPWDLSTKEGTAEAREAWEGLTGPERANLLAWLTALYEGELAYTDDAVGALLDGLDAAGKLADSLVVVWSDHGEEFQEHGALGHGVQLHSDQADGIGIFWASNIVPDAYSAPTTHNDLVPTVLDALGMEIPADVSGTALGAATSGTRFAFLWTKDGNAAASVERGGLKLIYDWRGRKELYDRNLDRNEAADHYTSDDPDVEALWALLRPRVVKQAAVIGLEPVDMGP